VTLGTRQCHIQASSIPASRQHGMAAVLMVCLHGVAQEASRHLKHDSGKLAYHACRTTCCKYRRNAH
jgi:hypothetical protein